MIVGRGIENLDLRVKREYLYIENKYLTLAFNCRTGDGHFHGKKKDGKNILLCQEGIITLPQNYEMDTISKFDAVVTYSTKFKELHPNINVYITQCPANWEAYHWLETFVPYESKFRGICSLHTVYDTGHPLDRNFMKHKIMAELQTEPHLELHTYGRTQFGKAESYRGDLGHRHSNYHNIKTINEYMFCYACEPLSDDFWGHNYVTERVFNTFKSKTVLVYYGAPNIAELIPPHLFVDVRQFSDMQYLSEYLIELSYDKKRYRDMIEEAYMWNLKTTLGDMRYQEEIYQKAIKENPL